MTGNRMRPVGNAERLRASASNVDTPTQISSGLEKASPLAVAAPIRTPVNEPGPTLAASIPISEKDKRAFSRQKSIMGKRLSLCVSVALTQARASGFNTPFPSSSLTQTAAVLAAVSNDSTYMSKSSFSSYLPVSQKRRLPRNDSFRPFCKQVYFSIA